MSVFLRVPALLATTRPYAADNYLQPRRRTFDTGRFTCRCISRVAAPGPYTDRYTTVVDRAFTPSVRYRAATT